MTEPQYRHVLVPLDGSEFAAAAVPTARALAERFAADLQAVSVAEAPGDVEIDLNPVMLGGPGGEATTTIL